MSAVEVYFDKVLDILSEKSKARIPIPEVNELVITHKIKKKGPQPIVDQHGNVFDAKEATEIEIKNVEDIVKLMKTLHSFRQPKKGFKQVADISSRSHCVVTIT